MVRNSYAFLSSSRSSQDAMRRIKIRSYRPPSQRQRGSKKRFHFPVSLRCVMGETCFQRYCCFFFVLRVWSAGRSIALPAQRCAIGFAVVAELVPANRFACCSVDSERDETLASVGKSLRVQDEETTGSIVSSAHGRVCYGRRVGRCHGK